MRRFESIANDGRDKDTSRAFHGRAEGLAIKSIAQRHDVSRPAMPGRRRRITCIGTVILCRLTSRLVTGAFHKWAATVRMRGIDERSPRERSILDIWFGRMRMKMTRSRVTQVGIAN